MKTTKEALTFFADTLENEKEFNFNMSDWYRIPYTLAGPACPSRVSNPCGTAACLAGTVAYRIDPTSTQNPAEVCAEWVLGFNMTDWYLIDKTLTYIFTRGFVYGKEDLYDITKETVINSLRSLAALDLTWKGLNAKFEEEDY